MDNDIGLLKQQLIERLETFLDRLQKTETKQDVEAVLYALSQISSHAYQYIQTVHTPDNSQTLFWPSMEMSTRKKGE